MLFNSIDFFIFFPLFVIVYFSVTKKMQQIVLLIGSYIFYAYWNIYFLALIIISSFIDYTCSHYISKTERFKKFWLIIAICSNLFILGFFKYYNFFIELTGLPLIPSNYLLPIGISFYTFQSISYTVDVFKKKIEHERSIITFLLFIAFFPQLIAGPIERAKYLIPQLKKTHIACLINFQAGFKLFILGLFYKVCVADGLSTYVDFTFNNIESSNSLTKVVAMALYSIQIFCDFAGYSIMARGIAKVLGFTLTQNFNAPYRKTNIKDLINNWHISFIRWLRDYIYYPLGGNREGKLKKYLNLMIVMFISGLWHGANLTYVLWGGLLGFSIIFYNTIGIHFSLPQKISKFFTLTTWCFTLIFFRSENIGKAILYIKGLFSHWELSELYLIKAIIPFSPDLNFMPTFLQALLIIFIFLKLEKTRDENEITYTHLLVPTFMIVYMGVFNEKPFIYFIF